MTLDDYLYHNRIRETEFAERSGVAQGYLNRLRNGRQLPSLRVAARIMEASDGQVRPEDFFISPLTGENILKAG